MNSLLVKFPEVEDAIEQTRGRRVTVRTMSFNGDSSKGLWLTGTAPWLEELEAISRDQRPSDCSHLRPLADNVDGAVTGRRIEMQMSEEYTPEFTETCLCGDSELYMRATELLLHTSYYLAGYV